MSFFKRGNDISDLAQVRYVKGQRTAGSAEEKQDALDRDHPVRLRRALQGPQGAPLESAGPKGRQLPARA